VPFDTFTPTQELLGGFAAKPTLSRPQGGRKNIKQKTTGLMVVGVLEQFRNCVVYSMYSPHSNRMLENFMSLRTPK
jgi:hypothetical protein